MCFIQILELGLKEGEERRIKWKKGKAGGMERRGEGKETGRRRWEGRERVWLVGTFFFFSFEQLGMRTMVVAHARRALSKRSYFFISTRSICTPTYTQSYKHCKIEFIHSISYCILNFSYFMRCHNFMPLSIMLYILKYIGKEY